MLETVDQIELSELQRPAHAPPGEIAAALRALAYASSEDAAQDAYHRVLFAVGNNHAGSYFPVVLDAVSFFGEILTAGTRWARARTLDVLIELVGSFGPDPDVAAVDHTRPEDLPEALRARVASLNPILEHLGTDPSEPDVQSLARDLLECLADRG